MQAILISAAGMGAAAGRLAASAQRVGSDAGLAAKTDLAAERVEQISAETDFSANAAVLRTADAMTGVLLDLLA
ncbi:flagellar hook protein FlgE [Caulobacter sp. CCNWLY153]|uniref:flagellar hook protein FlgE n=1 Tax=unclassified Caulobacter TaxID=2648921 RepID=UPI002FF3F46C